jgi:hypothetical protein
MESDDLDERKRAIQQLVVELLAPYHSRLQPMELAWPFTSPASHDQQLWLTLQQESALRVIMHFIMYPENWTSDEDRMLCQCTIDEERKDVDTAETLQR